MMQMVSVSKRKRMWGIYDFICCPTVVYLNSVVKLSSRPIKNLWEPFISPTSISSTVHLVDSLFVDSSSCRQYVLPTVHFADNTFYRQYVLPTVHFTDSTFHRQYISPTVILPTLIPPTVHFTD